MAGIGLEHLLHACVVSAFPGQPVAEVLGDMKVANRDGVRIAVRPLSHLSRCPRADAGQRAKDSIDFAAHPVTRIAIRPVTCPLNRPRGQGDRPNRPDAMGRDTRTMKVRIRYVAPSFRRWRDRHSAWSRTVSWLTESANQCLPSPAGLAPCDLLFDHRVHTGVERTPGPHEPPARCSTPRLQHLRMDRLEPLKPVARTKK